MGRAAADPDLWCMIDLAGQQVARTTTRSADRWACAGGADIALYVCALQRTEPDFRIIGYVLTPEHNNPVKRDLVAHRSDLPWSSRRCNYLEDRSDVVIDRMP